MTGDEPSTPRTTAQGGEPWETGWGGSYGLVSCLWGRAFTSALLCQNGSSWPLLPSTSYPVVSPNATCRSCNSKRLRCLSKVTLLPNGRTGAKLSAPLLHSPSSLSTGMRPEGPHACLRRQGLQETQCQWIMANCNRLRSLWSPMPPLPVCSPSFPS